MITPTQHTDTTWNFINEATGDTYTVGRGNGVETEADALNALLSGAKEERIVAIKAVAQERIYAIVPAWRQNNLMARSIELRNIKDERPWTEGEAAEDAAIKAIWAAVKAIRAASDIAEAEVWAAASQEEIDAVQF